MSERRDQHPDLPAHEPAGRRWAAARPAAGRPRHSTWKPLQMPSTGPPSRVNATRPHDWREPCDRADAQVVPVGEAAGDDDRVERPAIGRRATAAPRRRPPTVAASPPTRRRVSTCRGSGRRRTSCARPETHFVKSPNDERVHEELPAHVVELDRKGPRKVELDAKSRADVHVLHALEAERRQRPLHRDALGIEDLLALGRTRTRATSRAGAGSSQAEKKDSPVMRSYAST